MLVEFNEFNPGFSLGEISLDLHERTPDLRGQAQRWGSPRLRFECENRGSRAGRPARPQEGPTPVVCSLPPIAVVPSTVT